MRTHAGSGVGLACLLQPPLTVRLVAAVGAGGQRVTELRRVAPRHCCNRGAPSPPRLNAATQGVRVRLTAERSLSSHADCAASCACDIVHVSPVKATLQQGQGGA